MILSNQECRQNAQTRLKGNLGTGILISVVPVLIAIVVNLVFGSILGEGIILTIFTTLTNLIAGFMTMTMILKFARGDNNVSIGESLSPGDKLIKFVGVGVVIAVIGLIIQIPISLIAFGQVFVSQAGLDDIISGATPTEMLTTLMPFYFATFIGLIISLLVTLRLYMASYSVVDQEISIQDSLKESWDKTKGHAGQIFMMDLYFIGWFILVILTCGLLIFYVLPYYTLSKANLYLALRNEEYGGMKHAEYSNDGFDPIEEIKEEPKKEEWDF